MSGKASGWVWDQGLAPHLKYVLLAYADHADHEGNHVFPSVDLIARKCGLEPRTIQRHTRKLESLGYLIAVGGKTGGRRGPSNPIPTNHYRIPVDAGPVAGPNGEAGKGDTHVTPKGDTHVTLNSGKGDTHVTPKGDTHVTRTVIKNRQESFNDSRLPRDSSLDDDDSPKSSSSAPPQNLIDILAEVTSLTVDSPKVRQVAAEIAAEGIGGPEAIRSWVREVWPSERPSEARRSAPWPAQVRDGLRREPGRQTSERDRYRSGEFADFWDQGEPSPSHNGRANGR